MGTAAKSFRLRVGTTVATTVSDANTEFFFYLGDPGETSSIAALPTIHAPQIDPLESRTLSPSVKFELVSETITANLTDGDGRLDWLGRLVDWSESTDGGSTYDVLWTGRVVNLSETDTRGRYVLEAQDERWVERRATLWTTADTCAVLPMGMLYPFRPDAPTGGVEHVVRGVRASVQSVSGDLVRVVFVRETQNLPGRTAGAQVPLPVTDGILALLEEDVGGYGSAPTPTSGRFNHLRASIEGVEVEVYQLGDEPTRVVSAEPLPEPSEGKYIAAATFYWPSHGKTAGDVVDPVYFYFSGAEPTDKLPLHLGVADASHTYGTAAGGIDPMALLKLIYDAIGVRYDSSVFVDYDPSSAPEGLLNRWPAMTWRITRPENAAKWLEENIYKPFRVVPYVDAQGRIVPTYTGLPQAVDPNTLPVLSAADVPPRGLPSWDHGSRDAVNALDISYTAYTTIRSTDDDAADAPADRIRETRRLLPAADYTYDTTGRLGERKRAYHLAGVHDAVSAREVADALARELFDRYGDGPVRGQVMTMDSVTSGQYVALDQDSLKGPNPGQNARTGKRIVQVLTVDVMDGGNVRRCEYLDAGPFAQAFAAPNIAIAQNAANPRHAVDITISAVPSGAGYLLQYDVGDGTWRSKTGSGAETVTISSIPAGNTVQARVASTGPSRIRSDWSTTVSVATQALTAPSGLSTSVSGTEVTATWTVGETDYPVRIRLDGAILAELPRGSSRYVLRGLDASTTYNSPGLEVTHRGPYGGESSAATATFTTGSPPKAPDMLGLSVRPWGGGGRAIEARLGVRVLLYPGDTAYDIEVLRAPDSSGAPDTANAETIRVVAGTVPEVRDRRALDGSTWWYNARHVRRGYTDGDLLADWQSITLSDVDDAFASPINETWEGRRRGDTLYGADGQLGSAVTDSAGVAVVNIYPEAQSKGQNLLGPTAGDTATRASAGTGANLHEVTLSTVRVSAGDTLSLRCTVARTSGTAQGRVRLRFNLSGGGTSTFEDGSWVDGSGFSEIHGVTVPANATSTDIRVETDDAGTVEFSDFMLARGPQAIPFEEPPVRSAREDSSVIYRDISTKSASISDVIDRLRDDGTADTTFRAYDGAATHILTGEVLPGESNDGEPVSFSDYGVTFQYPPQIIFLPAGGVTIASGLSGQYGPKIRALNLTAGSFETSARLVQLVGTTTSRSATFSSGGAGDPLYVADNVDGEAWDDTYTYTFTVTVQPLSSVTVEAYTNDGGGWELTASRTFVNDTGTLKSFISQTIKVVKDGLFRTGDEFGLDMSTTGSGGTLTATNVAWETATAPGDETMSPAGAAPIPWVAILR